MSIEWGTPEQKDLLGVWDGFLAGSVRGHYCQLSTWLQSFEAYGFTFGILVARQREGGHVVGGAGVLLFGPSLFRAAIVPFGPIVAPGFESLAGVIFAAIVQHCRAQGAAFLQVQFPVLAEAGGRGHPALLPDVPDAGSVHLASGSIAASTGMAPAQMLWVGFEPETDAEVWQARLRRSFNKNTQRNIRVGEESGLELVVASADADLRAGFELIERNGREQNYPTRLWRDFAPTLREQVSRDQAVMLLARRGGEVLGAHYGVVTARRYSYLMGGTVRTEPDSRVGHFLHWNAMAGARRRGLEGYDFTSGGSAGVMQFKLGFRPQHIRLRPPAHVIFAPVRSRLLRELHEVARKNRKTVARLMSGFRRLLDRAPAGARA